MSSSSINGGNDEPRVASVFLDERISTAELDGVSQNAAAAADDDADRNNNGRCGLLAYCSFRGHRESQGINITGIARGAISMSNVYLANSMIHLACKQGGGFEEGKEFCTDYSVEVYGMKPGALISNIAIIASVLAAFLMPIFGAIIDFTPHRRMVGVGTALVLFAISAIQIGTVETTWFAMAILQAIIFMIYQVQKMAIFAYFPEVNSDVGPKRMNEYTSTWSLTQFSSQATFNICILACVSGFALTTIQTSMLSQTGTTIFCMIFLTWGWKLIPNRPRKHKLPKGQSILLAGFKQNWRTCKSIWKNYKTGLRWFLVATAFAEAAAAGVTTTAVIFLNGNLQLSPLQIGIFFQVSLMTVIVGTKLGAVVTKYTNPVTSLKLSQLGLCLVIAIGVHLVQYAKSKSRTYIWGAAIGIFLGWFYPTENLVFAQCLPKGQETELAGFFMYCTQILGWFPPLIFTVMVQNDINMKWALTAVSFTFLISIFFLCLMSSWPEVLEEARTVDVDIFSDDEENDDIKERDEEEPASVDNIAIGNKKDDNNNAHDNGH